MHEKLPVALREAVDEFGRHLARVENRSEHTVRAYVGDVVSLLHHAAATGRSEPADLDIALLRGWLAARLRQGAARTSQARRAAAARAFTAWAHRAGLAPGDPGTQLASPKAHRGLPTVLRALGGLTTTPVEMPVIGCARQARQMAKLVYVRVRIGCLRCHGLDDFDDADAGLPCAAGRSNARKACRKKSRSICWRPTSRSSSAMRAFARVNAERLSS